jgi:aminopeptidase N
VAHQWWGHTVGWATHHDQWLSEGFAEFSAGLFLQYTEKTPGKYLKYWGTARDRLMEKNAFGRRANDAGPITLGLRLSSEKNPGAYNTVVYQKGGYVLHMLRLLMFDAKEGDKPFIAMMQDFVGQHKTRNATTESFQRVVEKHMRPTMDAERNGKMDWFFRQWVYGTAVPKLKLEQTVTPQSDGSFVLKGTLSQAEVPDNFITFVPLYVEFDAGPVRAANVRITGNKTVPFQLTLKQKPKRVQINAWHDVLEQP